MLILIFKRYNGGKNHEFHSIRTAAGGLSHQQEKMLIQFNDDDDFEQNFQVIKSPHSKSVTERTKRIYQPNINASFNIRLL